MANHKSAVKRARQNEIRRLRNKGTKTRIKNIVKDLQASVGEASSEETKVKLNTAQSVIDKASKSGVIHKRTASRKISRLTKLANSVSA